MTARAELIAKAQESARHLADLARQKAALSERLADALAIQAWQVDAFASGPCRLAVLGVAGAPLEAMRLELHLASGETRAFRLLDVPRDCWPATLRERKR